LEKDKRRQVPTSELEEIEVQSVAVRSYLLVAPVSGEPVHHEHYKLCISFHSEAPIPSMFLSCRKYCPQIQTLKERWKAGIGL
jgi:hypothetical protein